MKIPKQLYIVQLKDLDYPLGFWNEYLPNSKAFEKKRQTQLKWAHGYIDRMRVNSFTEVNGELFAHGEKPTYDVNCLYIGTTPHTVKLPTQPIVWNNDFLLGFKVLESRNRYSTSNKVWRILDPRGIKFEISSGAMAHILLSTTIVKGEIMERCAWGTDGHHKILALESEK